MTYRLKGFMAIDSLTVNTIGVVAPIGEISPLSLTYAKDKGTYTTSTYASLMLYSFTSKYSATGAAAVPDLIAAQAFNITNWIYQKQTATGASTTQTAFLADFIAQYGASITAIDCGQMIQVNSGLFFPEWVAWKNQSFAAQDPAFDNLNTVWFCDQSFQNQYDDYAITVVPPLSPIDQFFTGRGPVNAAIAATNYTTTTQAAQVAKAGYPETIITSLPFNYVDPLNPSLPANYVPTNWTILIYGLAGNTSDNIRSAIQAYIAANSTHTLNEWKVIFPDIYKATEFYVFPRWNNYAIPAQILQAGTYSPIINLKKELDYLKAHLPIIDPTWIDNYTRVLPFNYKSLALLMISSVDNRVGAFSIDAVYPDIINVPTSDAMFESMGTSTKLWLLKISLMIMTAETVTTYSSTPTGMQKILRNNILYIASTINGIQYLVATKASTPVY
jgi:hypothetical protein